MQNQLNPVLIFAQSGRFLAQSATQAAGYRVWVADCFGDQDMQEVAERWHLLPQLSDLSIEKILTVFALLTKGQSCTLICGSGIEGFYPLIEQLPANIRHIGNSADTIHQIKTPRLFFALLQRLKLPFPKVKFNRPKTNSKWLIKSGSGLGGTHIQYLSSQHHKQGNYYQQYISGTPGSVLFMANSQDAVALSINRHFISNNALHPFRLARIDTPWLISNSNQEKLILAIKLITREVGLLGLNSLDFIISEQQNLLILEINPRISASAELINNDLNLFQNHINFCERESLENLPIPPKTSNSLHVIYADCDAIVPKNMAWPSECSDIPVEGSLIKNSNPICTLLLGSDSEHQYEQCYDIIKEKVLKQLLIEP